MLHKPTDNRLLEALNRLQDQQGCRELLDWLEASLRKQRRDNDTLEGVMLYRSQGCCQTLQTVLDTVKGAGEMLRLMRKGRL